MAKIRTLQIYRGTTAQNDAYTGSAGELTMDTTTNELRLHDGSTAGGHVIGSGGGYHPDLFSVKWSDHQINDVQWLRADTFSWQSGAVYQAAYQHLEDDIDGKTLQSETVAGTTIQFYLADDGHKICPASEESNVSAIYNATGVAWYYIIDTANTRFKLPRSKHNKYAETLGVVGNGITLGLTDGTGTGGLNSARIGNVDGTFWSNIGSYGQPIGSANSGSIISNNKSLGITTDPTKSGIIAQQEQDTDQYKYLYFYVGNFTQTALENTAGLNAELFNGKADIDFSNTSMIDYVVEKQDPNSGNNYTWYRKYASGWVEQGGIVSVSSEQTVVVSLPQSMNNTDYHITSSTIGFGNNYVSTQANTFELTVFNQTQTGFSIHVSGQANRNKRSWQVSGMAA